MSWKVRLIPICALLSLLPFVGADRARAETAPGAGTECQKPPEFGFTWYDTDVAALVVTGKQKNPVYIAIEYLCGTGPCPSSKAADLAKMAADQKGGVCWSPAAVPEVLTEEAKVDAAVQNQRQVKKQSSPTQPIYVCAQASEAGTVIPLCLDRKALLKGGGYVSVTYVTADQGVPDTCKKNLVGIVPVKALQKHRLSFDAGPVYTLGGDGSFKGHAEVAVSARSQWSTYFEGGVAMRYSAIGEIAEDKDEGSATEFNPFKDGGGVLESNLYGMVHHPRASWLGLAGGAGFTTLPGDEGSELTVRQRWFVGFRTSVQGYNAGEPANRLGNSAGYAQLAYLKDDLFEDVILDPAKPNEKSDESDRYALSGEIEIPRVGTEWARLTLRAVFNLPMSGDGPSDIRVSALVSIDPRSWFPGLKGKGLDL